MAKKQKDSMIIATVITDKKFGIGNNNKPIVDIPDASKNISRTIGNSIVIVGRKTYESLIGTPMAKKVSYVITNSPDKFTKSRNKNAPEFVSMEYIKEFLIDKRASKEKYKIAIIGGAKIYEELLPYCDLIYIVKVLMDCGAADVYFPNLDHMPEWEMIFASEIMEYEGMKYQCRRYKNGAPYKPEKLKKKKKTTCE